MAKDKNTKNDNKMVQPKTNDDQLGENASGMDKWDEVYKKEHHQKSK